MAPRGQERKPRTTLDRAVMPGPATLRSIIDRFRQFGAAPALVFVGHPSRETWSYADLAAAAHAFAASLVALGLRRGDPVAIAGPNDANWIAGFWGVVAACGTAVPLDAQAEDAELARMLEISACRFVVTTAARAARLEALLPSCRAIVLDAAAMNAVAAAPPDAAPADPGETAIIVFTSGTTGTPKGVALTHANLLSNVSALLGENLIGPRDRILVPLPLHHIYPLTVGLLTPLACGAVVAFPSGLSGPQLVASLSSSHASTLLGVPRLYTALVADIRATMAARSRLAARALAAALPAIGWLRRRFGLRLGRWVFAALRRRLGPRLCLLVSGGAALDRAVEEKLLDLGWEVLTGYGLTETSPILSFNRRDAARPGTAGLPLPGTALRIADADAGGIGEIQARGPGVFIGYLGDSAATLAAFTADGWFRTGDLGRLDAQGYLQVEARITETIVLPDGKKLMPETVEAAYAGHPLIGEIAVLARDGVLVGLVVPNLEAVRATGAERLVNLIRDALANAAQNLPSHMRLGGFAVARARLPRTHLGKIRRHLLPALYDRAAKARVEAAPAPPGPEDLALLANPVAASAWRWLGARYPDRRLDLDTSPQLDLGIDSLGWIDLTLALQREVSIVLSEASIARIVTLRDLLREAVSAAEAAPTVVAAEPARWTASPGPGLRLLHLLVELAVRCVMRGVFRLRVAGVENLPPEPFLLCPNHTSYLDPFAVAAALPHRCLGITYWGGWTGVLFTGRLRRLFSRSAYVIPVDPDRAVASSLATGSALLAQGRNLVWFPEGERSRDGGLSRFQRGIGMLFARNPVPIVPAHIDGAFAAWPRGRRFPRLGRITVRFGQPLDPAALSMLASGRDGHGRVAEAIRDAVALLAQRTG